MEKGFKYRIYPNKTQQNQLDRLFGCKRFVWNYFLNLCIERLSQGQGVLQYEEMSSLLTRLKQQYKWLCDAEKSALQNTLKDLYQAFLDYKSGAKGEPQYKSKLDSYKSAKMSLTNNNIEVLEKPITLTPSGKYRKQNCKIKLPKLKRVKIAYSRQFEGRILSATVSKSPSGKYYISLCCIINEQSNLPEVNKAIGIDLGLKDFLITSEGKKIDNPKHYRKYEQKLIKEQRRLSRKQKKSSNRNKQRLRLTRVHEKISNTRMDFIQGLSTQLIQENRILCFEDLKPSNMLKNHKLAKSISDASWGEFRRIITYKALWHKRVLVFIDPFYPSSQLCSNCENQNSNVKDLNIRTWTCPVCSITHDRDVNAAKNILKEGLRKLDITA